MIKKCWDLSQIYNSQEEFEIEFKEVGDLALKLESFRGKLTQKDKNILKQYFLIDDEFSAKLEKLAVYAHCKNDDNGKDEINIKNYAVINDFYSSVSEKLSFIVTELASLDIDFLNELKQDPNFKDYSRQIEYLIRNKKHTLSEKEEALIANVSGFSNFDDIYSTITDVEMQHGEIIDENGEKVKLTTGNYNLLLKNKNQDFRKNVMETYLEEYKRFNLTISNLYISHIKYKSFVSQMRNYSSVLDSETYREEVSNQIMQKNIENVSKNSNLISKYFNLKKEILKLDVFNSSDISADLPFTSKSYTYEESIEDIRNAFKPLGTDYQEMFDRALSEGWIDALPREFKASGGYTISTYLTHPYILLNFDGTEYWKSAIAHEFGHAMHSYYSEKEQPFAKSSYTIFVAEVASLTNEILLSKYMLSKETNKEHRMQILADFLSLFYLNVFNSSMLAEFELYVHNEIWEKKSITANDLNQKFKSLCEKYFGDSVVLTKNYEYDWERKSHIFRDYYLYKYSTGLISACVVATKILSDRTGEYVKKYKKFLSLGDSMDPINSLKVADIDITSDETYKFGFDMFESYLNELKSLYEEKLWL